MNAACAGRTLACLAFAFASALAGAAGPAREVHGVADTFAAPGVALAWGVLRDPGGGDAATVVVRLVTDAQAYPAAAAVGVDPFSSGRESRLAGAAVGKGIDVRVPRSRFADFPRTEFLFYDSAAALVSQAPRLVVFYLGVPDTTPEFATEAALAAHLAERISRLGDAWSRPQ